MINVEEGSLQNVITFPPDGMKMLFKAHVGFPPMAWGDQRSIRMALSWVHAGAFLVESSLGVVSDQRTDFKFSGAKVKLPQRTLNIPPFGKGW